METENLEKLKRYLKRVLSLRPIEELSPLSVSILKNSKVFSDEIGAWAGSLSFHKGLDKAFLELMDAMSVNCDIDQRQVIEIALESFEWISDTFEGYPFTVAPYLNGDEVFWAWDFLFMSDDEIRNGDESDGKNKLGRRRVVLKRFRDLGIDVLELGEHAKTETGDTLSPVIAKVAFSGSEKEINDRIARNVRKKFGEKEE